MEDAGIFYGPLVYFAAILVHFVAVLVCFMVTWNIFPVLVCCTRKNLATLVLIVFVFFYKKNFLVTPIVYLVRCVASTRHPQTG
jgi:hypothetical protein